ncbi:redoxin domain-containing protein [Flavihumibacter solisilvae]|uniref:redoxin domain-containing protein n=1 Tax=Flavihumibacter solisilvae TaxID=1349421 RepID=UPI00068A1D1C|nr:redoxin domain-containing protein [Flavihumibacter solisilvae]
MKTIIVAVAIVLASSYKPAKPEPSLKGASGWINSQPLQLKDLRGKVVLVDFWTFTCINWRRTMPYIREWEAKYRKAGLVVIGVHTPEFNFEYDTGNVSKAVREINIVYPVALDNNYEIWNSFSNQYWPALYLLDAKGKLRYQNFGESDYLEAERMIQRLLKEVSKTDAFEEPKEVQGTGIEVAADWANLASPENFLGYERTQGFASPGGIRADKAAQYMFPRMLNLNYWALSGQWIIGKEHARSVNAHGVVKYRFHARDLHMIMAPSAPGSTVRFRILINGKPPGEAHGLDTDADGNGVVTGQGMYQLIRQPGAISDAEFEIEFEDAGVDVFDFTFG